MQFHKRRQYIVNKAVQWASVIYVFVIVLAILAFHTWLTHWRLSAYIMPEASGLSLSTTLLVDVVITLAVTGVFTAFAVIFGSHKVAGPIYRCEQTMKRLQKGDLTDFIKLRKGDFLVPFSEEINLALANLRDFAGEDRTHVQEATRQLTLVRGAVSPDARNTIDRALETLSKIGKKLKIDQDAAKAILQGATGATSQAMISDLTGKHPVPHGRAETPVYSAAKTMMLQPPDKKTLRGEQRAPGAGLALAGDGEKTVPPPAGVPGLQSVPRPAGFDMDKTVPPPAGAPGSPYAAGSPMHGFGQSNSMAATLAQRPAFIEAGAPTPPPLQRPPTPPAPPA